MKILLNLATLKKGGGQNVGLNLVKCLISEKYDMSKFFFVVAKNSTIESELLKNKMKNFISVSNNPIKRMFFELMNGKKLIKEEEIDIVYTLFGVGLYSKKYRQVSGSADSNLYFPEIDFWSHYKGISRLIKWLIDSYRIWGLKRSSAVIFENKIMEERSKKIFDLKKTTFIKPSINVSVESKELVLFDDCDIPKGLFLCGWQLNKNIMLIPEIAKELKKQSIEFKFVITAPLDKSKEHIEFMSKVEKFSVEKYIMLIGPVKKDELTSLYQQIDFVFLLSRLESFSNNIIEAWFYKRLLIISDELWAKSICKEAAVYVKRSDVKDIVGKIKEYIHNSKLKKVTIEKGEKEILNYPTINERTKKEIEFIKEVYEGF